MKEKYYDISNIDKTNALYRVIIGERSNGKTMQIKIKAIKNYIENGKQTVYMRRYDEDLKPKYMGKDENNFFAYLIENDKIREYTNEKWSTVLYKGRNWYLANKLYDDQGNFIYQIDDKPFMLGISLTNMEHGKGGDFPNVNIIAYDEFLAPSEYGYLSGEFMLFMHSLSTIIRLRNDVVIYLVGNTINRYSPYFIEMGISKNVKEMNPGDICVVKYKNRQTSIAIEFSDIPKEMKKSNIYFDFGNPQLDVITGEGTNWQLSLYNHLPSDVEIVNIIYSFFIIFDLETFQCDISKLNTNDIIIFAHRKTTPLKEKKKDLIYCLDFKPYANYRKNIFTSRQSKLEQQIVNLIKQDRICYADNEVGASLENYFNECR